MASWDCYICNTVIFLLDLVGVLDENGKFLLAAKRSRRMAHTEYAIFMDSRNFSRSSTGYIGKLR
jgi:tubby and related proteins